MTLKILNGIGEPIAACAKIGLDNGCELSISTIDRYPTLRLYQTVFIGGHTVDRTDACFGGQGNDYSVTPENISKAIQYAKDH